VDSGFLGIGFVLHNLVKMIGPFAAAKAEPASNGNELGRVGFVDGHGEDSYVCISARVPVYPLTFGSIGVFLSKLKVVLTGRMV